MAGMSRYPLPWTTLFNDSTGEEFCPVTPWIAAARVEKVRATFEARCLRGDIKVSFAYQTANVENAPDTAVAVGGYQTTNGVKYPTGMNDISSATLQKQLVRFGYMTQNASSSTLNLVRTGGSFEIEECGG